MVNSTKQDLSRQVQVLDNVFRQNFQEFPWKNLHLGEKLSFSFKFQLKTFFFLLKCYFFVAKKGGHQNIYGGERVVWVPTEVCPTRNGIK